MENMENSRLILREFKENDVDKCFENFAQDKELRRYLPMYPVKNKSEMKDMIYGFIKAKEGVLRDRRIDCFTKDRCGCRRFCAYQSGKAWRCRCNTGLRSSSNGTWERLFWYTSVRALVYQ